MIHFYNLFFIEFPFSFTDDKNNRYANPIVLWLHMCLIIFNFVLVIVFENLFVENSSGLYLPPERIFFAFFAFGSTRMEEPRRLQSLGLLKVGHDWGLHFHFSLSCTEKEMASHSSFLAWRIPRTGEPGGLLSMGVT